MRLIKIARREDSVFSDTPCLSLGWFMSLSVESNWFVLNEVINLPFSGPQAYSYIVMEITGLQNHSAVVICQRWPWAQFLWIWPCRRHIFSPMPLCWFCWLSCSNLVESWRGWLHRGALSVCPVRLLGQLGSKKPQTGTSIVNSSFGQESYSFVLCVLTLPAQPRYYLFTEGLSVKMTAIYPEFPKCGIHTGDVFLWHPHPWDRWSILLSTTGSSLPNTPPISWCAWKRLGLKPMWIPVPVLPLTQWHWGRQLLYS